MTNNPYKLNWVPNISRRHTRAYMALADAIADDIKNGRLKSGHRLPPQRLLAYTLGLNTGTVNKAYKLAIKRGLISGEIGRGSFVRGDANRNIAWPNENPYNRAIDFCDNFPCPIKKISCIQKNLAKLGKAPNLGQLLQYQQNSGREDHRMIASTWLNRFGVEASPDSTLITNGALHAGFISLMTLCRAGDTIVTEEFSSQAIIGAAKHLKLRIKGVKMNSSGIIPEHLEEILRKNRVAAAYFVPTLHNPTSSLLPIGRRQKVAKILSSHDIPIIEDDIFAPLLEKNLPPISSYIPDSSFYISGLSKALAPGLRLAFLKTPSRYYQDALNCLRTTTWLASPLLMEMAGNMIASGEADMLIKAQRLEIQNRQRIARKILRGQNFHIGENALHGWLSLREPWRASQLKDALMKREVVVQSSDSFAVERSNAAHAIRICLGSPPSSAKVTEGLNIVSEVLRRGFA